MTERQDIRLPIVTLAVAEQRYSCHGCGNCCRDFTVQLRPDDLERLREQGWEETLGGPVTVDFRGVTYLRQREDGACIFLMENGLCRIHAEHGYEAKPIACQLFPFSVVPGERDAAMGVSFACASVQESKGAALDSHRRELLRMTERVPESVAAPVCVALKEGLVASRKEIDAIVRHVDRWVSRSEVPLGLRLDGLAWFAQSLLAAKLNTVREDRLRELVATLLGALPDELTHLPIEPATARQRSLVRQAVFARTEDPKIPALAARGRMRTTLAQLAANRRFRRGRGLIPRIGVDFSEGTRFESVDDIASICASPDLAAVDELLVRYVRATLHGRRAWGAGYYGWPVTQGLAAHVLNLACIGWLARARAAGRGANVASFDDVRAAVGRVDRMAGRAPWLGSAAERWRLSYLALDDGLRRVIASSYSPRD